MPISHACSETFRARTACSRPRGRKPTPWRRCNGRPRQPGERGLRPAVTALDVQDGRVRLTFAAVRFDALVALLDALARTDGLRAVDAVLAARVEPGTVRAELTLAR
jgi:hypothetical protein